MPKMTGGRFIAETIKGYGIDYVFFVPYIILRRLQNVKSWPLQGHIFNSLERNIRKLGYVDGIAGFNKSLEPDGGTVVPLFIDMGQKQFSIGRIFL